MLSREDINYIISIHIINKIIHKVQWCQPRLLFRSATTRATLLTAKHQWSFSKAGRFPSPKSKYFHTLSAVAIAHSIDHRSCLSERKASIELVTEVKYLGSQQLNSEPGNELPSDLTPRRIYRGFSFTANRENLKFDHYMKTVENTPWSSTITSKTQIKSKFQGTIRWDRKQPIHQTVFY